MVLQQLRRRRIQHSSTRSNTIMPSTGYCFSFRTTTRTRTEFRLFFTLVLLCCWTVRTTNAISLLNGRYETWNDVTDYLNLALDIVKMNEEDDFDTKLDLYKNVSVVSARWSNLKLNDWIESNPSRCRMYCMWPRRRITFELNWIELNQIAALL